MSSVRDQVAFITGAASGIGYALTARCLDQGMRVMLADLDVQSLDRAAAALGGKGELATVACDVASIETLEQARQQTIDCFGSVHWLVNNAGVLCEGNVGEMPVERWRWASTPMPTSRSNAGSGSRARCSKCCSAFVTRSRS